jgi:adenosylhomocysteine nucleosidase
MRLAILSALRWECRPVLKALSQVERQRVGRWTAWQAAVDGGEVWLVQTGVGPQRAGDAAAAVAASAQFDLLISAGCAGALEAGLCPGDVVIASRAVDDERRFEVDPAFAARAQQICVQLSLRWRRGAVLTSPTVLTRVADKREAASRSGAIAVAMEASAVAAVAAHHGVPFAEVRAILDTADLELHESGDFMDPESGRLRPLEVLRLLAARPSAASQLLHVRRMMNAAERSLERFFAGYFA